MRSRQRAGFPAGLSATAIPAAVSFALSLGLWLPSLIGPTRVDTVSLSGPAPSSAQRPATARPLTHTQIGRTAPRALPLPTTHDRPLESAQTHRQATVSPPAMLRFDENRGQTDRHVSFLALDGGDTVFLTPDDAVLALAPPEAGGRCTEGIGPGAEIGACVLHLRFAGANARAGTAGLDRLPGLSNDFIGSDPHKWQRAVPGYAVVTVHDLYRGVDLAYDGAPGYLIYTLTLAPRTDPRVVRLQPSLGGRLDAPGNLALSTSLGADSAGALSLGHLTAYQVVGGVRRAVSIRYAPRGLTAATVTVTVTATVTATAMATGTVGFALGTYDHAQPLRITQTLGYGGTGAGGDTGNAVAAGGGGNVYVAGYVTLAEFPLGPAATAVRVTDLVAVTELSPGGGALVYRTLLGGSGARFGGYGFGDAARGIAVDGTGRAYVTGRTYAPDFPTTPGALSRTLGSARGNAFVAKLSADGGALVYSTFLGGHGGAAVYVPADRGNAIAVDGAGHAYVAGHASSPDFPTSTGAYSRTLVGASDAFVTELDTHSGRLVYSTFLGGHGLQGNAGNGIALGDGGRAYVVGTTDAPDFPTTDNAYATAPGSRFDDNSAFVSELNASGNSLIYSTYLGGSRDDDGNAIAVDTAGRAFVTGQTGSSDFPTTQGAFATALGGSGATKGRNAFVAELTADGSDLIYGAYLGGSDADAGNGIVLDGRGHALVAGVTTSPNFPLTPGVHPSPGATAFVTELDGNGSKLVYSTTLAGKGAGIAVTRVSPGYIYVPLSSVTVVALPLR